MSAYWSAGNSSPESEISEINLEFEMERRIQGIRGPEAPTILRLPHHFRHRDESVFEPEMVSIGPYHWGKDNLKLLEAKKWLYLRRLLDRFYHFKDYQSYYSKAKSLVKEAKRCYRDELGSAMANDDNFALMLLLDGSFILECFFARLYDNSAERASPSRTASDSKVGWASAPLAFDAIKFENQIPFFVLEHLYAHLTEAAPSSPIGHPSISNLVSRYLTRLCIQIPSISIVNDHAMNPGNCHHLLHFFHLCVPRGYPYISRPVETLPWIPTARALHEAGIKIKCEEGGGFLEVSFVNGTLLMSPLVIDQRTNSMFHNLLAWEQYHPEAGDYVTSYCTFIGCLVDTAADVLLLRQAKILINHIGSDEQAARLLSSLPKYVGDKGFALWRVFDQINAHCQSSLPRYRARLTRDYCGHPWAIISVLAAFVLLVLTAGQTVYTVLSFYH